MCREDIFVNKMFLNGNKSVFKSWKTLIKASTCSAKKPQWTNYYIFTEVFVITGDEDQKIVAGVVHVKFLWFENAGFTFIYNQPTNMINWR